VITPEEMRSVGARSPAEALRLAPGLGVARINAQRFAVGVRGFDNEFNGKVLAMQDGRAFLSPQFGGIFWDAQDTILADVARIEVVRGPVGAACGVNAFSGVVNVVTKSAWDTQGALAEAGGGTFEPAYLNLRYGGTAGRATAYRIWARAFRRGETESAAGAGLDDAARWRTFSGAAATRSSPAATAGARGAGWSTTGPIS
jgi:iron complex outermembrane receptor protein